jgi:hypothetical protein
MRVPSPLRLTLLGVAIVAALLVQRHAAAAPPEGAVVLDRNRDTVEVSDDQRSAGLTFAPSVAPADQAWIRRAVAAARPEAQRLIGEVDGMVTIQTEVGTDPRIMGWTQPGPTGFRVGLNISQLDGERTIDRDVVVLHELGHVVDFALVDRALDGRLDAGIPRGTSCGDDGLVGACASTAERIADTFAKWALGGAVSQVGAGYGIANPPSLEDWGAPLTALAAGLPSGPS